MSQTDKRHGPIFNMVEGGTEVQLVNTCSRFMTKPRRMQKILVETPPGQNKITHISLWVIINRQYKIHDL